MRLIAIGAQRLIHLLHEANLLKALQALLGLDIQAPLLAQVVAQRLHHLATDLPGHGLAVLVAVRVGPRRALGAAHRLAWLGRAIELPVLRAAFCLRLARLVPAAVLFVEQLVLLQRAPIGILNHPGRVDVGVHIRLRRLQRQGQRQAQGQRSQPAAACTFALGDSPDFDDMAARLKCFLQGVSSSA
ncbi:hypothetical protein EII19_02825 [Comamonadaceae bacterium OH2310_COT-174]|nr:hypothetical protein EII19_02825 [Comamonadaceae bacterium OH2310_COT-174]